MKGATRMWRWGGASVALIVTLGCGEESQPTVRGDPGPLAASPALVVTELDPGPPSPDVRVPNPYEGDGRALAEGERLYTWFNCAGCHGANGGGGMGPPFADEEWIYGGDPENLFASIAQGRPSGMPAFGQLIPDDQIWQLALYVRSLAPADTSEERGTGVAPP